MSKIKLKALTKLLSICLLMVFNNSYGQNFTPKYYNSKDGIAQGHHGYIIQDHKGYIWTTSQGGLTRFDGKNGKVITYDHSNNRLLDINEQSPIFESKDSMLWIGSFDGLYMYNQFENSFKFWGKDSSNIKGPAIPELTYITEDKNNILWIACYGGLYSFDRKHNKWNYYDPLPNISYKNKHHSEKAIRVLSIDKYNDNILWLGGLSRIFKFDISSKRFLKKYDLKRKHAFRISTFALSQVSQNNFYIGIYGGGLQLFNAENGTLKEIVTESDIIIQNNPFKIVRDIIQIDSSTLLCTNYSGKIFTYNISTNKVKYFENIEISKHSHDIIKDRDGNLWITSAEGITKLKPAFIKYFKPADKNKKYDILISSNDYKNNCHLSFTTEKKISLECFNKKKNKLIGRKLDFEFDNIDFLYDTILQKFLIIKDSTVFKFSKEDLTPKVYFKTKNIKYNRIKTTKKYIYLIKNDIVDVYNLKGENVFQYKIPTDLVNEISAYNYSKFKILNNNEVFFINRNKIIKCIDEYNYKSIFYEPELSIRDFTFIDSDLFFATRTGLYKAKMQNDKYALDKSFINPYKSQEIQQIRKVNDIIYMNSFFGITGYNTKTNKRILLINERDGISSISDFSYYKNKLYGYDTKKYFEIDLNSKQEHISDIVIEELLISGYENKFKNIDLKYNQNSINISWNPIYFGNQDEINYSYRLEGYNNEWVQNGKSNKVNFNNLGSGDYNLKIKAEAIGHSYEKDILNFSIAPPWWKTWWFYFVSTIFLSVFFYFFNKNRVQKIKKKSQHKQELAELELNALRAQMNPHFIFNSLNSIKRLIQKNDSENAIDYLTNFSMMIRQILSNSDKKLISLKEEIDFCARYLNMEKLRFQEKINWEINNSTNLNLDDILIPPLILQPYIENALWHGIMHSKTNGKLTINITENNDCIQIEIDDNGIGRKKSKEFNNNNVLKNKSRGMEMSEKRGKLSSLLFNKNIKIKIIDKIENGEPSGTTVVLDFLNCKKIVGNG